MAGFASNNYTSRLNSSDPYGRTTPYYGNSWGGFSRESAQMQQGANRQAADDYTNYRQADLGDRFGLTALSATAGPDGKTNVSFGRDPNADLDSQLSIRDKYNQAAEARYMDQMNAFMSKNGQPNQAGVSRNDGPIREAEQASETAAFARAKDRAGLVARGSLESAQDVLAGRGLLGSGLESQAYNDVINKGQQDLSDVIRQQAVDSVDRAQHRADTEYTGAIQQRGQNIQAAQSMLALMRRGGTVY